MMTMSPLPSDPVSEGPVAHRRSQREAPPGPSSEPSPRTSRSTSSGRSCGAHPARELKAYRRRTTLAAAFVAPTASGVETDRLWPTLILLVVGLLLTPLLARRAARVGGWPHAPAGSTIAPMWILRMR